MDNTRFTRKEAAAYLRIGLALLDQERSCGRITCEQRAPGCKVFFSKAALDTYIARNTRPARPEQPVRDTYRKRRSPKVV